MTIAINDMRRIVRAGEPLRVGEDGSSPSVRPSALKLTFEEYLSPAMTDPPDHALLDDMRIIAYEFNDAIATYAMFLAELAGAGDRPDADRLDELATQANASLRAARTELDRVAPDIGENLSDQSIAIISAVAVEALNQHIRSERRRLLMDTITSAQPVLADASAMMQFMLVLVAGSEQERYEAWFNEQSKAFSDAEEDLARQRAVLAAIEARNTEVVGRFVMLRALNDAYLRLPSAHEGLEKALRDDDSTIEAIRRLYEDVKRVQRSVRALEATP
jgi:hypothetical protein